MARNDLFEYFKHPIRNLLSIFNLQRIGPDPMPPVKHFDNWGMPQSSDQEMKDPFMRPSQSIAETIKRRGELSRIEKYAIYEEMDRDPLVSEILNAYAEAITTTNYQKGVVVWVEAENEEIQVILNNTLKQMGVQERAFALARDLMKFGDVFEGLVYTEQSKGLVCMKPYNSWRVARVEDEYYRLMGYSPSGQDGNPSTEEQDAVPPWDILHWRLLSKDRNSSYGTGLFDSAWEKWEDLQSMEDQMVLQRLLRRPDRLMVLLDTTGLSYQEAFEQVKIWEKYLYKEVYIDSSTPRFQSRGIPMSENRDLILPKGPNNNTDIRNFPSTQGNDLFRDIEMVLGRFTGSVGMDKGYFGFEGGQFRMDMSLAKQDPRFARRAMRGQFMFLTGLSTLLKIHLALNGLDPHRKTNRFDVHGMPVSSYLEIEYNELLQMRFDLVDRMARTAQDLRLNEKKWVHYVLKEVAKMPEDLIVDLMSEETTESKDPERVKALREGLAEHKDGLERASILEETHRACFIPSGPDTLVTEETARKIEEGKGREWNEAEFETTGGEARAREYQAERAKDRLDRLKAMAASIG